MNICRKLREKKKLSNDEELRLAISVLTKFISETLWHGKASRAGIESAARALGTLTILAGIDLE